MPSERNAFLALALSFFLQHLSHPSVMFGCCLGSRLLFLLRRSHLSPSLQVLHAPQLDKPWGYAQPAAAAPTHPTTNSTPAPPSGHWPLILLACAISSAGVVEMLLKARAEPNTRNLYGLTTLVAAVHNDGLVATEKLAVAKVMFCMCVCVFGYRTQNRRSHWGGVRKLRESNGD